MKIKRLLSNRYKHVVMRVNYHHHHLIIIKLTYITVEPRFNEPLFNEVLGIKNDFLQPGQSDSKMYGTESRFNEPRFNEILVVTNTIYKSKRKIHLHITNECQHVIKDECQTDQQGSVKFMFTVILSTCSLEFLVP